MFAIPNGGYRTKIGAHLLKLQGVKAGVSDIFLPIASSGYHGLFIEMKIEKKKMSEKQHEFAKFVWSHGYQCKVCYSADEAIDLINKYLGESLWKKRKIR